MDDGTVRHRSAGQTPSGVGYEKQTKDVVDEPEEETGDAGWTTLVRVLAGIILTFVFLPALGLLVVSLTVPAPINPVVISLPEPPKMEGVLEVNDLLTTGERLFEDEIMAPESIVFHKGHMYTGTGDGKIVDIKDGKMSILTTLGTPPCGSIENGPTCGRPLGLRMHNGSLFVIDTYLGLYKISVDTGKSQLLLSSSVEIAGVKPAFLNNLDIDSGGIIYFTDTCKQWQFNKFLYPAMEGSGTGRLIRFDPHKKTTKVLIDGLHFGNGVQLSRDEDFVLVAESTTARILRYYLKGPKQGQVDTFIENLPGLPDNIRESSGGGYWLCGSLPRGPGFSLYDFLAARPAIRRLLSQLFSIDTLQKYSAPSSVVYEVDAHGEIVRSFWDVKLGRLGGCSEVNEHKDSLYIGSFHSPFIGKLDLKKLKKV
ncbi:Adipocyte plasma membrane-associated protein [Lamellibrachia satsuma]|nr:Adipocyte plasma membrane-associated protein [Lamellibrachia satsuma]